MPQKGILYVAVDFDGTIVEHQYPFIGQEVPGALQWIKTWQDAGAKVILHTMRDTETLVEAVEWLNDNEVKLYGANFNPDQAGWTDSTKTWAEVYVDDCGVLIPTHTPEGFTSPVVNWDKIGPAVYAKILGVDNVIQ